MYTVKDVLTCVEGFAPAYMQEQWDNVGLLCGRGSREVKKILVALDPFEDVCQEAKSWGADVIVTHHPLIFHAPKSITEDTALGRCILFLAENGIAAINAHTNLDQVSGGVNDCLAKTLGLEDVSILNPQGIDENGKPWGLLRAGTVPKMELDEFLQRVKKILGCPGLRYVDGGKSVCKVAVGGGACAGEMQEAVQAGCDTFVTADGKYNQFWDAKDLGLTLIDAGHFWTENPVCQVLTDKLREKLPGVLVKVSENHTDCIKFC